MSRWVSVDPGESTGYAVWEGDDLIEAGTLPLWEFIDALDPTPCCDGDAPFERVTKLVVEDWALYPWEVQNLAWDKCRTARGIGALELIARQQGWDIVLQPAKIKEAAEAGGATAYFLRPLHPNRHANDAIRHGSYHIQTTQYAAGVTDPTSDDSEGASEAVSKPQTPSRGEKGQRTQAHHPV